MSTQMKINVQKNTANKILDSLFVVDPFCIVAGGAPRDWHLGKVATDIDIFLYIKENIQLGIVKKMLEKVLLIKLSEAMEGHNIPDWYKMNPNLRCVFNFKRCGVKIQIMVMRESTFKSVLPNFPLSICHAWYKNEVVHLEKHFIRSITHKAIYKTSVIYNDEHQYIQKILAKFPDFTYYENSVALAEHILDNQGEPNVK